VIVTFGKLTRHISLLIINADRIIIPESIDENILGFLKSGHEMFPLRSEPLFDVRIVNAVAVMNESRMGIEDPALEIHSDVQQWERIFNQLTEGSTIYRLNHCSMDVENNSGWSWFVSSHVPALVWWFHDDEMILHVVVEADGHSL